METTRKPPAGEAGAGTTSEAAASPLEQTVLGIAPPGAGSGSVAPSGMPAPREAPARPAGIATAPLIPVSGSSPPSPAPAAFAAAVPAGGEPVGGSTLPVVGAAATSRGPSSPSLALDSLERTATTAEYLQAAREAALMTLGTEPRSVSAPARAASVPPAASSAREPAHVTSTSPGLVAPPLLRADVPPPTSRGFEPVPPVRAPLAESLSGAWGPVAEIGSSRPPPVLSPSLARATGSRREAAGRWLLLAAVALVSVSVVWFGGQLLNRHRTTSARTQALAAPEAESSQPGGPPAAPASVASRALLANLPAPDGSGGAARVTVVSATGGRVEPASAEHGGSASSESQLAAAAARHVLSGNFAEALPIYQELERGWPSHTAYGAMAKLLRARVGTSDERPMVAPASPKPAKERK